MILQIQINKQKLEKYQFANNTNCQTCSMTSGAIQHGVPTKVCLTFCRERSLPVASQAETPKSAIWTVPSSPSKILPALISLKKYVLTSSRQKTIFEKIFTCEFGHYYENIQVLLKLLLIQLQLSIHQILHVYNLKLASYVLLYPANFLLF